ncbi:hypothetical protein [Micromonospora tulbaghiae]|uniref:hypothetical protein n=1 Tax=Micromonospora tulbaghiae TaxID=479978 RepID=UPI00340DEB5E
MTAASAAAAGRAAAVRCRSRRALALRVVPIRCRIMPTDCDPRSEVARRMRTAYAVGGREQLACEVAEVIREATHGRAESDDERAVLLAWARYTYADAVPAWLVTAAAEGWQRPDWH